MENAEIEELEEKLSETLNTLDKLLAKQDEIQNDMPKIIKDIIFDLYKIQLSFKQEKEMENKLKEYFEIMNKKYDI
ncbi:MAG: hypothetical protein GYA31_00970 [Parcubacteria group bacterium]|nr:hypothetical protein [Parcubacteria group bacterium]